MTTIPTCERCGHPHVTPHGRQACAKHKSKRDPDGNLVPCGQPPITGTDACRFHGGSAPQVRRAAAVNAAEAEAARQVATLGLRLDVSPTDALLEEVQWTAGHVAWLRQRVQELGPQVDSIESNLDGSEAQLTSRHPNHAKHGLTWGTKQWTDKHTDDGGETTSIEAAGPSVWYQLYAKERDHLVAVCSAALKAGVEERRVRLAEQQGDLVAEVIRRILDALNLTPEQQQLVPVVVPQQLRLIAGGA